MSLDLRGAEDINVTGVDLVASGLGLVKGRDLVGSNALDRRCFARIVQLVAVDRVFVGVDDRGQKGPDTDSPGGLHVEHLSIVRMVQQAGECA